MHLQHPLKPSLPLPLPPGVQRNRIRGNWILIVLAAVAPLSRQVEASAPYLQIAPVQEGFHMTLAGANLGESWVIQHSGDGKTWKNLMFLQEATVDDTLPSVDIPHAILPEPGTPNGFFRAVRLQDESPLLRRLLTERARWRLSASPDYRYELRQNMGMISWHGTITVAGGQVASFETINLQPPFVDVPEIPTIEDLFDRIERALDRDAATVEITWDARNGIPLRGFIDLDPLLSDEESGWSVEAIDFN